MAISSRLEQFDTERKSKAGKLDESDILAKKKSLESTRVEHSKVEMQLFKIMQMVIANSQLILVHGILINTLEQECVFVQIVHNTDDDNLLLFYITDFQSMNVKILSLA